MSVHYQQIECKSFLHHFNKKFLPFNWGANPYRGCEHSCPYCFARYTHEYLGYNPGIDFDNRIFVKINAANVLARELSHRRWKGNMVDLGSVCDPYQPGERRFGITRQVLEVFAQHGNPLIIGTKASLILRDLDVLSDMAKRTTLRVNFTLTTLDENIRRKIEPRAASVKERLEAIKQLSDAGITVGILFMPIFPYLTDNPESINGVVKAASNNGAKYLIPQVLSLRTSCRNSMFLFIRKEFPEQLSRYYAFYRRPYAPTDYTSKIYSMVDAARRRHGIAGFEIVASDKKQRDFQLELKYLPGPEHS